MKAIRKSACPEELDAWAHEHPQAEWKDLRTDEAGDKVYKIIKEQLLKDQNGICAYCERKESSQHHWCVEHFHPKSDISEINWAFQWENLLLCCSGGERDKEKPRNRNLSCSAAKKDIICDRLIINPLKLPIAPPVFTIDMDTGELQPNHAFCEMYPNICYSADRTQNILENTIGILNLNCKRLCRNRLSLLGFIEKQKQQKRIDGIAASQALLELAEEHIQPDREFFTTRRIALGSYAEERVKLLWSE